MVWVNTSEIVQAAAYSMSTSLLLTVKAITAVGRTELEQNLQLTVAVILRHKPKPCPAAVFLRNGKIIARLGSESNELAW